jgi:signal transduction histidine kinase
LGLAIARGIVEAHGGRICAEGATGGVGVRVAFTVPIGDEEIDEEVNHDQPIAIET